MENSLPYWNYKNYENSPIKNFIINEIGKSSGYNQQNSDQDLLGIILPKILMQIGKNKTPDVNLPTVNTPNIEVSPNIGLPQTPNIGLPQPSTPSVGLPSVGLPSVNAPSPNLQVEIPSILKPPSVSLPNTGITPPSFNVPLPNVNVGLPKGIDVDEITKAVLPAVKYTNGVVSLNPNMDQSGQISTAIGNTLNKVDMPGFNTVGDMFKWAGDTMGKVSSALGQYAPVVALLPKLTDSISKGIDIVSGESYKKYMGDLTKTTDGILDNLKTFVNEGQFSSIDKMFSNLTPEGKKDLNSKILEPARIEVLARKKGYSLDESQLLRDYVDNVSRTNGFNPNVLDYHSDKKISIDRKLLPMAWKLGYNTKNITFKERSVGGDFDIPISAPEAPKPTPDPAIKIINGRKTMNIPINYDATGKNAYSLF